MGNYMWLLYLLIMNYQTFADKVANFYYAFLNGFFMMRQIPHIWYVIKMTMIGTLAMLITFSISLAISGQVHRVWFTLFETKIILDFSSWTVINLGSVVLLAIIGYYSFRIATYLIRKRKKL